MENIKILEQNIAKFLHVFSDNEIQVNILFSYQAFSKLENLKQTLIREENFNPILLFQVIDKKHHGLIDLDNIQSFLKDQQISFEESQVIIILIEFIFERLCLFSHPIQINYNVNKIKINYIQLTKSRRIYLFYTIFSFLNIILPKSSSLLRQVQINEDVFKENVYEHSKQEKALGKIFQKEFDNLKKIKRMKQLLIKDPNFTIETSFHLINASNSLQINCEDILKFLNKNYIRLTDDEIINIFRQLDYDSNGIITYQDFKEIFTEHTSNQSCSPAKSKNSQPQIKKKQQMNTFVLQQLKTPQKKLQETILNKSSNKQINFQTPNKSFNKQINFQTPDKSQNLAKDYSQTTQKKHSIKSSFRVRQSDSKEGQQIQANCSPNNNVQKFVLFQELQNSYNNELKLQKKLRSSVFYINVLGVQHLMRNSFIKYNKVRKTIFRQGLMENLPQINFFKYFVKQFQQWSKVQRALNKSLLQNQILTLQNCFGFVKFQHLLINSQIDQQEKGYIQFIDFYNYLQQFNILIEQCDALLIFKKLQKCNIKKLGKISQIEILNIFNPQKPELINLLKYRTQQFSQELQNISKNSKIQFSQETQNLLEKFFCIIMEGEKKLLEIKRATADITDVQLYQLYQKIDKNKNNYLQLENIALFLNQHNIIYNDQQLTELFSQFDQDCDGKISYIEFSNQLATENTRK